MKNQNCINLYAFRNCDNFFSCSTNYSVNSYVSNICIASMSSYGTYNLRCTKLNSNSLRQVICFPANYIFFPAIITIRDRVSFVIMQFMEYHSGSFSTLKVLKHLRVNSFTKVDSILLVYHN